MACGFWRTDGRFAGKGALAVCPSAAIIGIDKSLAGFTALGVNGYAAESEAEAKAALEKAAARGLRTDFGDGGGGPARPRAHRGDAAKERPPVLILPGETGNTGQAEREIEAAIRQAAGAGLWGEEG